MKLSLGTYARKKFIFGVIGFEHNRNNSFQTNEYFMTSQAIKMMNEVWNYSRYISKITWEFWKSWSIVILLSTNQLIKFEQTVKFNHINILNNNCIHMKFQVKYHASMKCTSKDFKVIHFKRMHLTCILCRSQSKCKLTAIPLLNINS